MSNKSDHGERNICLSKLLRDGNVYFDWSVTTAFYSAIQFVEHKIFPLELEGKEIKNISEARKLLKFEGRHRTREYLVSQVSSNRLKAMGLSPLWHVTIT